MKILFFGDLAGTGFGTVTLDLGRALLDAGLDVRFVSQNDMGSDLPEPFASRTLPLGDQATWPYLRSIGLIGLMDGTLWADGWTPEAAIILGDPRAVQEVVLADESTRAAFSLVPTFHYCPIEGIDSPPAWAELWSVIHPVAVSEMGADEIERITGTRPPVIYHGIDTDQWRPTTPKAPLWVKGKGNIPDRAIRSKAEAKAVFMYDGSEPWADVVRLAERRKWIFRADRFMPRKMYASMLRSIAPVLATRPDVRMVIHCRTVDEGGNLRHLISKYPPVIASRMVLTGFHDDIDGISRDLLAVLYNAADLAVSTCAEGFGLTNAEAIACGVPVVGLDYAATPEVIGRVGVVVPVGAYIDNEYDYLWARPDEGAFSQAVASLLDDDLLRARLGKAGPEHVRTHFSWAKAALLFSAAIRETQRVAA